MLWASITQLKQSNGVDDQYNVLHRDGSFEFGYNNPDSYHYADASRRNVVKGEFGARNPATGAIYSTVYTAGPRGFRPRGKNIARKYDLNQNGPRAIGSRDDPYYDPFEDPSYSFGFKTHTHTREESANRLGNVNGRYSYLDDVGERHNVEYIAGKNTGFHVKTPYPDSNPRAYGPLYFTGRGRPIPRGRTSIQRGLDGSYRFVSAGPDQRRTETSDSTGHVRGSYTYLDDKGVQHSVHYIAGPETGYRVLKNVKGPHLPTVFPFGRPSIVPPDFYDYVGPDGDVFDTAANGRPVKPGDRNKPSLNDFGNAIDVDKDDYDKFDSDFGGSGTKKPFEGGGGRKPSGTGPGNTRPSGGGSGSSFDEDGNDDFGDLFGGSGSGSKGTTSKPPLPGRFPFTTTTTSRPGISEEDDGSYKPSADDSFYKPGVGSSSTPTSRPGGTRPSSTAGDFSGYDYGKPGSKPSSGGYRPSLATPGGLPDYAGGDGGLDSSEFRPGVSVGTGLYGSDSGRPYEIGGVGKEEGSDVLQVGGKPCHTCRGTIVTNVGSEPFHVPPGVSVRAHVQSIDLVPLDSNVPSPSEQFNADSNIRTEQLNESSKEVVKSDSNTSEETNSKEPTSSNEDHVVTTTTLGPEKTNDSGESSTTKVVTENR